MRQVVASLPWTRLAAMLGVIVAAVTLLEVSYATAPIPPGVDPGDWITRSGAYVGLPSPPVASFGAPVHLPAPALSAPRGPPPIPGRADSPPDYVAGGLLLLFFGISLIYVAFRFIRFGPLQLAFVGACMFSGTLLYMLFWGAYPNFFAFVFLNLAIVYLLAFARTGDNTAGLLLGVSLSLLYLAHSLTFAIAVVTVGVTAVLLLLALGTTIPVGANEDPRCNRRDRRGRRNGAAIFPCAQSGTDHPAELPWGKPGSAQPG